MHIYKPHVYNVCTVQEVIDAVTARYAVDKRRNACDAFNDKFIDEELYM